MKIYYDPFNKEEILNEGHTIELKFNEAIGEVQSELFCPKNDDSGSDLSDCGSDEETKNQGEQVNNIVFDFDYVEVPVSEADYNAFLEKYTKKVEDYLLKKEKQARIPNFRAGISWTRENFKQFKFFKVDKSGSEDFFIPAYYKDGNENLTFVYFMDGMPMRDSK